MAEDRGPVRYDLTLHIGTDKTGTSTIQAFLAGRRDHLLEDGVLYPRSLGGARHVRFGLMARTTERMPLAPAWQHQQEDDPDQLRRRVRRRLRREVRRTGATSVLVSDEALYGLDDDALGNLRRFLDREAGRVRVVVYLRRQDEHQASRYQQRVKMGATERLVDTARSDQRHRYDYHDRLRTWQRLVAPADLVVRRFEPESFAGGSLVADFVEAAGVALPPDPARRTDRVNESLGAAATEALRLVNLLRREQPGAAAGLPGNHDLVARLRTVPPGPTLVLPPEETARFMELWQDANERVAREFLGDPSGRLFGPARVRGETTAVQRLDPARLDELVEVMELPREVREPLRRIAAREAAPV